MTFVSSEILSKLGSLSRAEADTAPFGIVQMDNTGKIILYNKWESEFGGVPVATAEGKNFFTEIAPCTNNKLVAGRYRDGLESKSLNVELNYTFTYKMKPTNVTLHLLYDSDSTTSWIFVNKR